jgi:hypothetical protein
MTEIEVLGAHHPRAGVIQRTLFAIERTRDLLRLSDEVMVLILPEPREVAQGTRIERHMNSRESRTAYTSRCRTGFT